MRKRLPCFLFFLLIVTLSVNVSAATNKAARVKISFSKMPEQFTEDQYNKNAYYLNTLLNTTANLKKNNTADIKMWFPKALFTNPGDSLSVSAQLGVFKNDRNNLTPVYWLYGLYNIDIYLDANKKIKTNMYDEKTEKTSSAGKYAKLTTSGKYYLLDIKNYPLDRAIYSFAKEKDVSSFNLTKKYTLLSRIRVACNMKHKGNGYIYLDNLKVKTKTSQTVKYDSAKTAQVHALSVYNQLHNGPLLKVDFVKIG